MNKKRISISVLAVLFFVVSGIPAFAGDGGRDPVDLRKAVSSCQYKVRQLESKVNALEGGRNDGERGGSGFAGFRDCDAVGAYGSAYYGYMLDN